MIGKLIEVISKNVGSCLSIQHHAGDTKLYVADITSFWDYNQLIIDDAPIGYTVIIDEDISDDENIPESGTYYLLLDTALYMDYEEDTPILVYPLVDIRYGTVQIGDETVTLPIDTRLWSLVEDGIRK